MRPSQGVEYCCAQSTRRYQHRSSSGGKVRQRLCACVLWSGVQLRMWQTETVHSRPRFRFTVWKKSSVHRCTARKETRLFRLYSRDDERTTCHRCTSYCIHLCVWAPAYVLFVSGIVECLWFLLKGKKKMRRTLLMLINAMCRVACDLSRKPLIQERKIDKEFSALVHEQNVRKGKWCLYLIIYIMCNPGVCLP